MKLKKNLKKIGDSHYILMRKEYKQHLELETEEVLIEDSYINNKPVLILSKTDD